ncbi:ABC transporter substrate-binding protein [Lentibacillus kimchii]
MTTETATEEAKGTISFADPQWDSIRVHNHIAQFILENGYDYDTETKSGSTAATFTDFTQGNIDVTMEVWPNNYRDAFEEAKKAGDIDVLKTNFTGQQGFFVPTYVIEGDKERGIEPIAPDLESVDDLPDYQDIFEDPEDPEKGRIIGGYSEAEASEITMKKVKVYGLDETYNHFTPGTEGALSASFVRAYENKEPWVGYYWTPTALATKYDMTMLEEPDYDEETWNDNFGTKFPPDDVYVSVYKDFEEKYPDAMKFLEQYKTSTDLTGEALVYMDDNDASAEEAAKWWVEEHEDVWAEWVPDDVAQKVQDAY